MWVLIAIIISGIICCFLCAICNQEVKADTISEDSKIEQEIDIETPENNETEK